MLHAVNDSDYIGVSHEDDDINDLIQQRSKPLQPPSNTTTPQPQHQLNGQTHPATTTTTTTASYQCQSCKVTIDPATIAWQVFQQHVKKCDPTRYNVCMFCLRLFPKEDIDDYKDHVEGHIGISF